MQGRYVLKRPVQLGAQLIFELLQAIIAKKRDPRIPVVLEGQVASEGAHLSAFDAIKVRFGSEGGGNDLLPDVSGIDDRVDDLTFIRLHDSDTPPFYQVSGFLCFLFLSLQHDITDHFLELQPLIAGEEQSDPSVCHAEGDVIFFRVDPDFKFLVAIQ